MPTVGTKVIIDDKYPGFITRVYPPNENEGFSGRFIVRIHYKHYPYYEYDYRNLKEPMYHEATVEDKQKWWDGLSEDDKNAVKSLPNFDADKFYICTGIKV